MCCQCLRAIRISIRSLVYHPCLNSCAWLEDNRKPGTCTGDANFLFRLSSSSLTRSYTSTVDAKIEQRYLDIVHPAYGFC